MAFLPQPRQPQHAQPHFNYGEFQLVQKRFPAAGKQRANRERLHAKKPHAELAGPEERNARRAERHVKDEVGEDADGECYAGADQCFGGEKEF